MVPTWHCIGAPGFCAVLRRTSCSGWSRLGEPKMAAPNMLVASHTLFAKVQLSSVPSPPKRASVAADARGRVVAVERHVGEVERRAVGLDGPGPGLPDVAGEGRGGDRRASSCGSTRAPALSPVLQSKRQRSMTVVCLAASGVRAMAPPRAPVPLVLDLNVSPQKVCVPSLPPSMPIAPALPPLPTWFWLFLSTTLHLRRVVAVGAEARAPRCPGRCCCTRRGRS